MAYSVTYDTLGSSWIDSVTANEDGTVTVETHGRHYDTPVGLKGKTAIDKAENLANAASVGHAVNNFWGSLRMKH